MLQESMQRLEAIVHPLVLEHRNRFMTGIKKRSGQTLVLFDIPLLFETHAQGQVCAETCATMSALAVADVMGCIQVDSIAVASAPEAVQKARVLARSGMTEGNSLTPIASVS